MIRRQVVENTLTNYISSNREQVYYRLSSKDLVNLPPSIPIALWEAAPLSSVTMSVVTGGAGGGEVFCFRFLVRLP